jgi:hypothetical protein
MASGETIESFFCVISLVNNLRPLMPEQLLKFGFMLYYLNYEIYQKKIDLTQQGSAFFTHKKMLRRGEHS